MEMQLLVTAFIVSSGFPSVQPNSEFKTKGPKQAENTEVNDPSKIDENFRNLFDSIRKNDMTKTETYRNFLEQEAARGQNVFDTMKEEMRFARPKNSHKRMDTGEGSGEGAAKFKRDTWKNFTRGKKNKRVTGSTTTTVRMVWVTLPTPEPTPRTDSWDPVLGFDKIKIMERKFESNRADLEEKYFCKRDDKRVRKGYHYFDYENCLIWHCPKWPIPVGVYEFEYHNCTDIDIRLWPAYHKECRVHRCPTKRIDLHSPYILPTVPPEYRTVIWLWNRTVFDESDAKWR